MTLTSSAIAARFLDLLPESAKARVGRKVRLASLSPITSATIETRGFRVAVEAGVPTWDGLLGAIADRVKGGA